MTRQKAEREAVRRWGEGAGVWEQERKDGTIRYHVCAPYLMGQKVVGSGASFEEAFTNAREVSR